MAWLVEARLGPAWQGKEGTGVIPVPKLNNKENKGQTKNGKTGRN